MRTSPSRCEPVQQEPYNEKARVAPERALNLPLETQSPWHADGRYVVTLDRPLPCQGALLGFRGCLWSDFRQQF